MAANIILTKESSESEIKAYFNAILRLSQSDNEFPINLDEVWMLAYATKRNAYVELRKNFIEGIDFNLMQNNKVVLAKTLRNGVKYDCFLSLPCLEYFIARKVRPVFEVYRQVFHHTITAASTLQQAQQKPTPTLAEKVNFIFLCHQLGLPESDIMQMASGLIPLTADTREFGETCLSMRNKCALSNASVRKLLAIYALRNGLPIPSTDVTDEVPNKPEKEPKAVEIGTEARRYNYRSRQRPGIITFPPQEKKHQQAPIPHHLYALSQMLREFGYTNIHTVQLNKRLFECGILVKVPNEKVLAPSGKPRMEWQLTMAGGEYGMNSQIRETHRVRPLWWADRFELMLQRVGLIDDDHNTTKTNERKEGNAL